MILQTERLLLREWRDDDLDAAHAMFGNPEVMRYIPPGVFTRERTLRSMNLMNAAFQERGYSLCAVVRKADNQLVGESGLQPLPDHSDIEIAWMLNKPYWHQGYALEMARAVLEYGWQTAGLKRVVAVIDKENPASIRVANGLGMRFEGVRRHYNRDLMQYSLDHSGERSV
ncbi:MAG: GNAT family N-acetyltransferase [Candidatus Eremiobacteraeota bacterium]|nr:GNAT family N-acetyltransferase [Candidatus Eremiobacteraeota bacterium]